MLGIRLDKKIEKRLEKLAKATGRSKSYYAKKAIEEFLEEREDYLLAISRLEDPTDELLTLDEMRRRIGLDSAI